LPNYKLFHKVGFGLLGLGVGVVYPFSLMYAMAKKESLSAAPSPRFEFASWLVVHHILNTVALVLTLGSVGVVVWLKQAQGKPLSNSAAGEFGVAGLMVVQIVIALARPKASSVAGEIWIRWHMAAGWLVAVGGGVVIALEMMELGISYLAVYIYSGLGGLVLIAFAITMVMRRKTSFQSYYTADPLYKPGQGYCESTPSLVWCLPNLHRAGCRPHPAARSGQPHPARRGVAVRRAAHDPRGAWAFHCPRGSGQWEARFPPPRGSGGEAPPAPRDVWCTVCNVRCAETDVCFTTNAKSVGCVPYTVLGSAWFAFTVILLLGPCVRLLVMLAIWS
jgi:hypothetical protein